MAVIAYGKLGGKELGYGSDLDIVFVYEDDDERAPVARQIVTRANQSGRESAQLFEALGITEPGLSEEQMSILLDDDADPADLAQAIADELGFGDELDDVVG